MTEEKIEELREFLDMGCSYSGTEEVVSDAVAEILRELGSECVCADEVGLVDREEFAVLDDFVRLFWEKSVELFLNVLGSDEEIN